MNEFDDLDDRAVNARKKAVDALHSWGQSVHHDHRFPSDPYNDRYSYVAMKKLLGLSLNNSVWEQLRDNPDKLALCEALSGPHGYAIYKVILARMESS